MADPTNPPKNNLPPGRFSGFTGYMNNLGDANLYNEEVNEGGGNFSVSGTKSATRTVAPNQMADNKYDQFNSFDNAKNRGEGFNPMWDVDGAEYKKWLNDREQNLGFRAKTDKQSYKQTSANNVVNTTNNKASNGNTGSVTNSATATATGGSVGNINIGGKGKTVPPAQTQQKKTIQPGLPGSTLGPSKNNTSTSSTTGPASSTRGYTGNTPFNNQATASATGGSVGNITINTGDGAATATPEPKANITGQNSNLGGGAQGLLSDMIGGGSKLGVKKTQGTPQGPPTRGGSTPYQFRGLANQFQSWGLNQYNNPNNTTT